jgi:DNA mismatch repair protein MutS2
LVYPKQFEELIGFNRIKDLVKSRCKGNRGKSLFDEFTPFYDIKLINQELQLTAEMKSLCLLKNEYPAAAYYSLNNIVKNLEIENKIIDLEEITNLRDVLSKLKTQISFISKLNESEYPELNNLVKQVIFPQFVITRIDQIVSKNGNIKDSASPTLQSIRRDLIQSRREVSGKLQSMLTQIKSKGWLSNDLSATIVNGRVVLPIDSTHKRKIKGIIHDESATGKTSYIEPDEVLTQNNEIRSLELAEQREIEHILNELTNDLRPYRSEIAESETIIAKLDFLRAKALFAIEINAIKPGLNPEANFNIIRGKHPLLEYNYLNTDKKVVPINISLNNQTRIIVISGPNAGGKSVALKTIALLLYMTQCGMLVPVGGTTEIGVFNNLFIELGDQQSIENDLSTYSSHLLNMKYFLQNANNETLILIDEFGSGTDPELGGAIAESILNSLVKTQCKGVITTHYTSLKLFAANTLGVENAAMLIDNKEMLPLYQLETGLPGSSYAIEIAHRTGIPTNVIELAREKAGSKHTDFDKHLRKVLRDKKYYEQKRLTIKKQEKDLDKITGLYAEKLKSIKEKERNILQQAKVESEALLKEINKKIENTIREIKEAKAEKEITKKLRNDMQDFAKQTQKNINEKVSKGELDNEINFENQIINKRKIKRGEEPPKIEKVYIDPSEIHIGSKVKIKGQESMGEVTDIGDKNAVVCFGQIYMSIEKSKLEKVSNEEYSLSKRNSANTDKSGILFNESLREFKPYIDIRGFNAEEALEAVTELFDRAIVLNVKELKILHGKGNGILRQYIRQYLNNQAEVLVCKDEDIRFGGSGITVVELK